MAKMIKSPLEFECLAEAYFAACVDHKEAITIPGLAYALGFATTNTLRKYRDDETHKEFNEVARRAALRVEAYTASKLYDRNVNVAGPVFALKNQGWTDKAPGESAHVTIKIDGVTAAIL